MATPPWMEGVPGGPPLQQQQANMAPQQQQQGPPQTSGLSALERMLDNAPKPPGAGAPDPYGQQWGPGPSQGPMSGYQTPTQGGPTGGWYQPPGPLPGEYPYSAPGDPNMPPQSFGPPPPQQAPQDQRYHPPDIQQPVGGPPPMSQQDLSSYYSSQNANTSLGPSDQWWGYPPPDGQGSLGPPGPSPSARQYDQYPPPPQGYYPSDPQGYGPTQPPHPQVGMYDPNISPANAFNGAPGGLSSQGGNQYAPPPPPQQFDQFGGGGGGGGYSQAPQHGPPPPTGGYFDQGYCETTPYGPVKNEPLPPSPYPSSPSLNRGSIPPAPTGQGPVQGQQPPQMFSPYGGQQGYAPAPTPSQAGLPPPPQQQQYSPMTSAQQGPPPQAGPPPAETKKPRRRTKKGKEPAPEPAPVPPSTLMQSHPVHMSHIAPMPGQYGPPPSAMGAPMGVGLPPEYNPYSQGPPGPPGYPMNPGGPMDANGPVMGGQCPPGMQPPMHNGGGMGQPHGMGPIGQQMPPQPPLPGQHPMYGGFGPPPDQQLMGPQQSHQHLPPQQQLQPGEQRGVKREGDLMGSDPSKRLASVLSQDDNALGHAPIEEGGVRAPLGVGATGEPGGADNGSTKDDNVTEKDESTQESTNTIESAKTETEDDDPSKMGATNGDRCRGSSKKENGESGSGKDGDNGGGKDKSGGGGGSSKDGNEQGGGSGKKDGDHKLDGDAKDNDDSDDADKKTKLHLRRNIKDIKDEASLDERTKRAQKEEKERMERLQKQRQRALNALKELRGQLTKPLDEAAKPKSSEGAAASASDEVGVENRDAKRDEESTKVSADIQEDSEDVTVVKEEKRLKKKEKDRERDGDVIELSSGDEDDESSDVPKDRDVINVSDESDDEDEELDFTALVHPIRDDEGRVLMNVGHDDDEEDIFIAPQLAPIIKPHQIGGVRFLYENVVESKERFETSPGFGCILAHSMGLGKTIQVITFIDVFLRHTSARKVLVITPINTIQNWQAEFDKWVPKEDQVHPSLVNDGHVRPRNYPVFLLNEAYKSTSARHRIIKEWEDQGGVMLMGYEMYRTLALKKTYKPKGRKKANNAQDTEETLRRDRALLEEIYDALVNPGPDLVVCDEGHRIKNCNASTSSALKDIKTRRRIVLTGYPLQNNLIEYWCMVDFVRPAYLGTKMEFTNMFERPIQNGQCVDSTPKDRQLMKFRAHVLHSLLIGFVQRRGHGVLKDALPHKEEHVIMVRMTDVQRALYSALVREFVTDSDNSANPLKIFAVCCKIWNHPDILYNLVRNKKGLPPTAVMDLDIDEGTAEGPSSVCTPRKAPGEDGESLLEPEGVTEEKEEGVIVKKKRGRKKKEPPPPVEPLQTNKVDEELNKISYEWAYDILDNYKPDDVTNSHKIVLLMEMVDTAMKIGDKLLVFSQSLLTLDLVERFLQARDLPPRPGLPYTDKWVRNRTYFRLDGSTSGQDREKLINDFNHNPCVALFLLSTRAGCLGINLIGANRIIVLDASWNPCHDAQAVCRVYRYGQQKPCYIYRFVCDNSLEKRIYDRQVNKQGMSDRVVDEMNPEAKLTWKDVSTLIHEDETDPPVEDYSDKSDSFSDPIMKQIVAVTSIAFTKLPFEHESLLLDQKDQKLTKYEKKLAKLSYEQEKKAAQLGGRCNYGGVNLMNGARGAGGAYGTYPPRMGMVRDFKTGQLVPTPMGAIGVNAGTALVHQLIKQGMTVQKMKVPRSLSIGLVNEAPVHVPAGSELFVMKTPRGVYLRLPCERVIAMRLPQTLDQLCMARPSPFRSTAQPEHGGFMHAAAARKPEVINLDDDSSTDVEDDKPARAKPKVITIESETISRNKGLYDMLTKDCKSAAAPKDDTDSDLLGRVVANKDLQLQVTEVRTERKARMKITQRKRVDANSGSGGSGSGGDRAHLLELNGDGVEVSEVPLDGLDSVDGTEGDADLDGAALRNEAPDDELFDLGGLLGTEISVSPVKPLKQRRKSPVRTKLEVDDDDEDDEELDDSVCTNGQTNMPSSNDNSQGSASDNSVGVRRNPLTIQSLDEMLGAPKTTNPAIPLLAPPSPRPIIASAPPPLELVEPDTTTT